MKRFYDQVTVVEDDDGFGVALDGRIVHSPGKRKLVMPFVALARAVADEWSAQGDEISPPTMGVTRLANSAIDFVAHRRADIVAEAARYGVTDLLCYRVSEPPDLAERQDAAWQPLLDWAESQYGAALTVTRSIMPTDQPAAAVDNLRAAAASYDVFPLTGLHAVTAAAGSIVIGLAMAEQRLDAEGAFAAAQIDEAYQVEKWGEDDEAAITRETLKRDIRAAGAFLDLCRDEQG